MAKKVTITAIVDDETNQNEFKNWLKTCPFSIDGGQTIAWENIPEPEKVETASKPALSEKDEQESDEQSGDEAKAAE